MLIRLSATTASVTDVTDLGRLAVVADAGADRAAALGPLGRPDGAGHVWLDVAALERAAVATLPPGTDADAWRARYASMLAYAADRGWLDPAGAHVRAHVEPAG